LFSLSISFEMITLWYQGIAEIIWIPYMCFQSGEVSPVMWRFVYTSVIFCSLFSVFLDPCFSISRKVLSNIYMSLDSQFIEVYFPLTILWKYWLSFFCLISAWMPTVRDKLIISIIIAYFHSLVSSTTLTSSEISFTVRT